MNRIFIILAFVVLVVVGYGVYTFSSVPTDESDRMSIINCDTTDLNNQPDVENTTDDSEMTSDTSSRYVEYSGESLTQASNAKRVLFFYASWCPTCRPVDATLSDNADQIPEGVTVIRVNYNDPETDAEEKALAQKYGVTYQHTFVQIDSDGSEVTKWNGGSLAEIIKNTQ